MISKKRYIKSIVSCLLLVILFTITACNEKKKDITVAEIIGTWVRSMSDGTETITFNSDMTYNKVIDLTSPTPLSSKIYDTYSIDGCILKINYRSFDTVSEYTVIIKDGVMTLDSGDSIMEFKKSP